MQKYEKYGGCPYIIAVLFEASAKDGGGGGIRTLEPAVAGHTISSRAH